MSAISPADLIARPWLKAYPPGVPADIDISQYTSLVGLMEESFKKNSDKVAYSFMGKDITWRIGFEPRAGDQVGGADCTHEGCLRFDSSEF